MIRQTEQPPHDTVAEPTFAGYRLDDSSRRGEAGTLVSAATGPDGQLVSLQVSADPVTSRRTRDCFLRLARARADVTHPALLGVREIGEAEGRVFAATEPFPERSLAHLLREGPVDPARALGLLQAVADGLDAAHAAGVVHRTLSAESILLDGERAKLDLFGLFTVVGQPSRGDVVRRDADPRYESPEGIRGDELTPASNVYSLTGLLVHALTGEQPFAHHDPVMIAHAHVSQAPPKPSERRPELPSELDAIVARGMAKDPAERPESAGALMAAAATALRTAPAVAPTPAASAPVARVAAYVGSPAAPAPVAADPVPSPVAMEPQARPRAPLRAWREPLEPLLFVCVVAALAGAFLGLPGGGSERAASTVRSPEQQAVQRLDQVRFRLRDQLAFAGTADEQADAAQRLAMAYGRAADHMSSPALVSAAHDASIAYLAVESAARAGDQDAYDNARSRVESAEDRIEAELAQIDRRRAPQ